MELNKRFRKICDEYVDKLFGYWNETRWVDVGEVIEVNGFYYSFEYIRYAVDNNIPREKLDEYNEFCLENYYKSVAIINFKSWLKGAPSPVTEDTRNWTRNKLMIENIKKKAVQEYLENERAKYTNLD